jgi:hypothetical protein
MNGKEKKTGYGREKEKQKQEPGGKMEKEKTCR